VFWTPLEVGYGNPLLLPGSRAEVTKSRCVGCSCVVWCKH